MSRLRGVLTGLWIAMMIPISQARAAPADFNGVWLIHRPSAVLRADNGAAPPLLPAAARLYRQNLRAKAADKPLKDLTQCQPVGPVRALLSPYPMMILATPKKVTLIHEYQHLLRHIYLDEPLPNADDLDPTFMGASVGRWDGDALVVETAGFNTKTTLDRSGLPHSDVLRLVERFRLIDKGRRLEDRITITDPKTFSRSWSATAVFDRRTDLEPKEYLCGEHNRKG